MKYNISLSIFRRSPRRYKTITRKKIKFFEVINNRKLEKSIIVVYKQREIKSFIEIF